MVWSRGLGVLLCYTIKVQKEDREEQKILEGICCLLGKSGAGRERKMVRYCMQFQLQSKTQEKCYQCWTVEFVASTCAFWLVSVAGQGDKEMWLKRTEGKERRHKLTEGKYHEGQDKQQGLVSQLVGWFWGQTTFGYRQSPPSGDFASQQLNSEGSEKCLMVRVLGFGK